MAKKVLSYILFILAALAAGAIGGLAFGDSSSVYTSLYRPPLSPPSIVFPIVWTALYVLMGISAAMVFINGEDRDAVKSALILWGVQLVANICWILLFFGIERRFLAFLWIILLIIIGISVTRRFWAINRTAGILMLPYLLWLLFAAYLNLGIWLLNG